MQKAKIMSEMILPINAKHRQCKSVQKAVHAKASRTAWALILSWSCPCAVVQRSVSTILQLCRQLRLYLHIPVPIGIAAQHQQELLSEASSTWGVAYGQHVRVFGQPL
ncbi:hypothetical protein ABBQ32_008000 [Trebouxia sp. C0010 RCD-2024]